MKKIAILLTMLACAACASRGALAIDMSIPARDALLIEVVKR